MKNIEYYKYLREKVIPLPKFWGGSFALKQNLWYYESKE